MASKLPELLSREPIVKALTAEQAARSVVVSNFPPQTTAENIAIYLLQHVVGEEIDHVHIPKKGTAVITFKSSEAMDRALEHPPLLEGSELKVQHLIPKEPPEEVRTKVTEGAMATTENESPATDEELDTIVTGLVQLDTPASTVKQDSKQLEQGGDAIINWRRALSDVTRIREALDEEKRVRRRAKRELREKEKDLINDLQVIIRDEQQERTRMEEELRESQRMLKELQTILAEERQENTRVDEELSQAKVALADKERFVKEIQRKLEEEQQSRIVVNEELRQATIDKNELEKRLQNDIVQVRRTLDNEVNLRSTKEQELRNKERIVNTLQRTLEEEQQARTRMAQELSQAKERLQSQLAQMRKTLDDRERIVEELQNALEEDQQARTAVDEELSQARSLCDDLEERLEDERLQSHSRQQHLQTKENVIREQRRRLEEEQQQRTALEERVRNLEQERNRHLSIVRQLQSAVSAAEEAVSESRDWIIQREEVVLSRKMLGKGAWGNVFEGTFRGCQVAVKEIHELILSDHNRRLFEREMSIASRCRHPNLLQFIGATNNEGSPLFVTELLDTSLRHVLSQRALNHEETVSLALDIAKGLNYLHLHKPSPIIHRDISSANVLLWRRDESWRAKLSDYGAANFMRQLMTVNPGAPIYCAPEALTTQQSPKVDVYSFGVLLCEMCIQELPVPHEFHNQIRRVKGGLRRLIQRCVEREPEARPTISEVIRELEDLRRPRGYDLLRGLFKL